MSDNKISRNKSGYSPCGCQEWEMVIVHDDRMLGGDVDQDPGEYTELIGTGCRKNVAGRATFAPGHDAKLKSLMILAIKEGNEIRQAVGGVATTGHPATMAENRDFGFAHMVRAAADRVAAKAAAKAAPEAPKVIEGIIKVGRWDYPARSCAGTVTRNTKRDGSGEWVAVADGKGFRNA